MMKTIKETLELALEALEYIYEGANNQGAHTGISWRCVSNKAEQTITALREALTSVPDWASEAIEQPRGGASLAPVQEKAPACYKHGDEPKQGCAWCDKQPAQQQEPAFHGFMDEQQCCVNICYTPWAAGGPNNKLPTAYYTTPPQRTWVGLTDEQIMAIGKELGLKCRLGGNPNIDFDYARAIEAAHGITAAPQLKEST